MASKQVVEITDHALLLDYQLIIIN